MRVSVKIPESYLEIIDRLVEVGRYASRGGVHTHSR